MNPSPVFEACRACGESFRVPQLGEWWRVISGGTFATGQVTRVPTELLPGTLMCFDDTPPRASYAIHHEALHRCPGFAFDREAASDYERERCK